MCLLALLRQSVNGVGVSFFEVSREMKIVQQPEASTVSDDVTAGMRWCMFWFFWAYYGISGFEVVLGLQGLSEGVALSVATFAALSFLAGAIVTAAWTARFEVVGLLRWVERLPDRLLQSAQLTGLVLLLGGLSSRTPWGTGIEDVGEPAFALGMCLAFLALFCKVRPLFGRRLA